MSGDERRAGVPPAVHPEATERVLWRDAQRAAINAGIRKKEASRRRKKNGAGFAMDRKKGVVDGTERVYPRRYTPRRPNAYFGEIRREQILPPVAEKRCESASGKKRRGICDGSQKRRGRRSRAGVPSAVHPEATAAAYFGETRKDKPFFSRRRLEKKGADDPRPVKIRVGLLGSPPDPVGDFDNTRSPLQTPQL